MDPTACLERLQDAHLSDDKEETIAACQDLMDWINKGGANPDWERFPIGATFFRAWKRIGQNRHFEWHWSIKR